MKKRYEQVILKLDKPKNFKITAGSFDRVKLKSCYYIIQAWFQNNTEDYQKELKKRLKRVKSTIYENLDRNIFKEDFIVTHTIPEHGGLLGQEYVTFEFTFYTTDIFHESIIKSRLDKITKKIECHFQDDEHFNVSDKKHEI